MAQTQIKITQLPGIGSNVAGNTLLPVVNTAGNAITEKATTANIGNFILTNAGTTLAPAKLANLAYSVVNAAQPNITSVGTLNINSLHISGGTNGQYLQTDGTGNLAWVSGGGSGNGEVGGSNSQIQFNLNGVFAGDPDLTWDAGNNKLVTPTLAATTANISGDVNTVNVNATGNLRPNAIYTDHYYYANGYVFGGGGGNGTPGGSNTQIQFNDGGVFGGNTGFTFNKTTGIFSSPYLAGNGNGLSNIQGANVSGAVGLATYAGTANAVAGANVSGQVSFAGTANSVAVANVVGLGNIATVALNGNGSQYLRGNGTWGNVSTANTGDLGFTANAMYNLGGVIVENADLTHGATAALVIPSNGNASNPVQITNTYGNITLTTGINSGSLQNWSFTQNGYSTRPYNVVDNTTNGVICNAGSPTIIYTATGQFQHTLKLLIQVEGLETAGQWDTQSCEMVVAKSFRNNNVVGSVYGLAYTSTNPLATFNAVWNVTLNRVQITCTPTSLTYGVTTRVCVTEMVTSD